MHVNVHNEITIELEMKWISSIKFDNVLRIDFSRRTYMKCRI